MNLKGEIAIVTGGASGFGKAIAETFSKAGAKVFIGDVNSDAVDQIAKQIGENARAMYCDVSDMSSVKNLVDSTISEFGVPTIIVNNAGITHSNQSMLNVDEKTFDRIFAVNVKGIYLMTLAAVPEMKKAKRGVIINIGSVGALRPRPGLTWYNSTKGAVQVMTKSMAMELAEDGIRVNVIAPVMSATGLLEQFMGVPDTEDNRKRFLSTIPMGRMCDPQDVANAALYLASEQGAFLTGVELPVDGGRSV